MKRMTLNAAELDKFIILNDEFGFTNETLEHVSQDKLYSKIVEVINSKKPVLVFDTTNIELYVGNTDKDSMYLTALYNNSGNTYTLTYDRDTDQLRIEQASETFISEDNVKTLFGNQSIIGTGNIDLYRHDLEANNVHFTIYSSSNLKVDSPQDLTTILKASVDVEIPAIFSVNNNTIAAEVWFKNKVWYTKCEGEDVEAITNIKDTITTI